MKPDLQSLRAEEERNFQQCSKAIASALELTSNVTLVIFGIPALAAAGIALRVPGRSSKTRASGAVSSSE